VRRLFCIAAIALVQPAFGRDCQFEKGEARWEVKNSIPSHATITNAKEVSLASLIALKNPNLTKQQVKDIEDVRWSGVAKAKTPAGNDAELHEGDIVTVTGYVYRARCQKDGDFHMEIGSGPTRKSKCLIVEFPDPEEIKDAGTRQLVEAAREALANLDSSIYQSNPKKPPFKVTITGQVFLDAPHIRASDPSGGRGTLLNSGKHCASNLWELHPVLELK
jgi:hypothetical protein